MTKQAKKKLLTILKISTKLKRIEKITDYENVCFCLKFYLNKN